MKKIYLIPCLVAGLALGIGVSVSLAGPYGTNITIFDGKPSSTGGQTGSENNEAEPGMTQSQEWDLEGFFLKGATLTMIGGFDFMNGVLNHGQYLSGDIFISTDATYGGAFGSSGFVDIEGNLGYEYVLDVNWVTGNEKFDIRELDSDSLLTSVDVVANAKEPTSNPWQYKSTRRANTDVIKSGLSYDNIGLVDDSGFENWENKGLDNHYAVSFDLTDFLDGTNLWGSELYFHFTMGCGNDNLMGHGTAPVPEPATMLLFGTGLIGLAGVARRRNKKKA